MAELDDFFKEDTEEAALRHKLLVVQVMLEDAAQSKDQTLRIDLDALIKDIREGDAERFERIATKELRLKEQSRVTQTTHE